MLYLVTNFCRIIFLYLQKTSENNIFWCFHGERKKHWPRKSVFCNTVKLNTRKKILNCSYAFLEFIRDTLLFLYFGKCFGPIVFFSSSFFFLKSKSLRKLLLHLSCFPSFSKVLKVFTNVLKFLVPWPR